MTGGTTDGPCTVRRSAVPPDGVPGFHQCDPRRISAAGPTLRGRVSSPYGGVASRWEAAAGPPFQRVPELSPADPRGSVAVYSGLREDLLPAGGARAPVRYGPEQGQPVDPRAPACAAHGPADPRRCPRPFPQRPRAAARRHGGGRGRRGHTAGGGADPCGHSADSPPFAHDGTERRMVVYLSPADKYHRLTHRPSQGQKGLDERAIMTSPW